MADEPNREPDMSGQARLRRGARWAVAPLLVVEAVGLLMWVNQHYPVSQWLFWKYAAIWAVCAVWTVACTSAGHLLLRRLNLPFREHLLMSLAVGVLSFGAGVFVVGLMKGLGPVFFCAWPVVLGAPGAPSLFRYVRRGVLHFRGLRRHAGLDRTRTAIFVFGVLSFF